MNRAENNSEKLFDVDTEWNLCRLVLSYHSQPTTYGCVQSNEYNSVLHGYTCNRRRRRRRRLKFFLYLCAHMPDNIRANDFYYHYVCCVPASMAVTANGTKWKSFPSVLCVCVAARTWCHGDYKVFCQSK